MSYHEKNHIVYFIVSLIFLATTIFISNTKDVQFINNLIFYLFSFFLMGRLQVYKKEIGRRKGAAIKNILRVEDGAMDEREKLIQLKTNNISLILALSLMYIFFLVMNNSSYTGNLKQVWLYYVLSGYMLCKAVTWFLYSRFIS